MYAVRLTTSVERNRLRLQTVQIALLELLDPGRPLRARARIITFLLLSAVPAENPITRMNIVNLLPALLISALLIAAYDLRSAKHAEFLESRHSHLPF
jgi:hypothetical protein